MTHFIIIETDDGNSVVECPEDHDPENVAEAKGGVLVDEGPYPSFEYACDALAELEPDDSDLGRVGN